MKPIFRIGNDVLGEGAVNFEWRPGGKYIAVCGSNRLVNIYDRSGKLIDAITKAKDVISMCWDKDGDLIALASDQSPVVSLWEAGTKKITLFDINMGCNETSVFLLWSHVSSTLAIGTNKGNLVLYNHRASKKTPIVGKHQRMITCGAFSDGDFLALGSKDAFITVSSMNGDSLYSFACNSEPTLIKFHSMKRANEKKKTKVDIMLSAVLEDRMIMLINLDDSENPINLQFQNRYGKIVSYVWFADGYILLGFIKGFVVCISAYASEMGQEIFSVQDFKSYLAYLCINENSEKALIIGDNQLKIRELNQLEEINGLYNIEEESKELYKIGTTEDGQFVAISSTSGTLQVFLAKIPILGAVYNEFMAILSSLNEITIIREGEKVATINIELEPTVIGVGPLNVAIAMNNRAWFYEMNEGSQNLDSAVVYEFEYISTINAMKMNYEFAVAKLDGRAQLHKMKGKDNRYGSDEDTLLFPDSDHSNFRLQDVALTANFLIYCTDGGHLQYFALEDSTCVNEYRHVSGIKTIFPEPGGIRLCFFDETFDAYIYNPVDDGLVKVPIGSTAHFASCLWENFTIDKDTFVIWDSTNLLAFSFLKDQIDGQSLLQLGKTAIPHQYKPLMLCKGIMYCQTQSGQIGSILLESHKTQIAVDDKSFAEIENLLQQTLNLKRWIYAWRLCEQSKNPSFWRIFAVAAMQSFRIDLAIRIFKRIDDVAMVWCLEEILHIEERNLLAGHLALILEQYDAAERLFLQSSKPKEALNMRRDLLHWDKALKLANRFAPDKIPNISKEYAVQLEFIGEYTTALTYYESGLIENVENLTEELWDHNELCKSGIARMSIRIGDIRRGLQIASELQSKAVKRDCAMILEQMKQYNEAAHLYELGGFYDRAAAVCLKAKNWTKVGNLLPHVRSSKIYSQYGKIMEGEKKYKKAALAYKNARDYDNLVRILLNHLDSPEEAVKVVKSSRSTEGAKLVAKFFSKLGDHASAIQFLVLSQCHQEAFQLAETEQKMDVYAEAIDDCGTTRQYIQLADSYAAAQNNTQAGKFYFKAAQYKTALQHLLINGEDLVAMKIAIECVAEAGDPELSRQLIDFLLGEIDGVPKDAKLLFRYYIAMKMNKEAAKIAIIIAREEQNRGAYRMAHRLLFEMQQELIHEKMKIPAELDSNLMLLHSYLIIKNLVKRREDKRAARLLMRVADNISLFPSHSIQILTSAVIECSKAGIENFAFKYAAQLLKPENRKKIDEKYRKKIEAVVRKSDKTVTKEDIKTACPFCDYDTEEYKLTCSSCKNLIPYCIITGRHIVNGDFAVCPSCNFPGYFSEFIKLRDLDEKCPMCNGNLGQVVMSSSEDYLKQKSERIK